MMLLFETSLFGLTVWLGGYLVARGPTDARLRYAGLGALAYAVTLASGVLAAHAPTAAGALAWARVQGALLVLPALLWARTVVELLPEEHPWRAALRQGWRWGLLPLTALLLLLTAWRAALAPLLAAVVLLPLLAALALAWQQWRAARRDRPRGLVALATLFFALGVGLWLVPLGWLPRGLLLLAIGGDVLALALAVAWLDAFDQGETLLPDVARSFDGALVVAVLFGGLVALAMQATGATFPMVALLLATVAAAIGTQVFNDFLQSVLDEVAFAAFPRLRRARAELRAEASALPRLDDALDLSALDEEEWARLTRAALRHLSDLPRLAASPLTRLPLVYLRLAERGVADDTLERAGELRRLLTESILRLKPRGDDTFGTTDVWRHFNVLYYPYVVGLKPFSRRADLNGLDPDAQAALDWFRTTVPERTFYRWQKAAARLVARDLREKHESCIPHLPYPPA